MGLSRALSDCLLGLTEPVMELRLNKRVISIPVLDRTTLSYTSRKGGEGFHPVCGESRRRGACQPSATITKDVSGKKKASDY